MMEKDYSICPFDEINYKIPKKCYAISGKISGESGWVTTELDDATGDFLQVFYTRKCAKKELADIQSKDKAFKKHKVKQLSWNKVIKICKELKESDVNPAVVFCEWDNNQCRWLNTMYVD